MPCDRVLLQRLVGYDSSLSEDRRMSATCSVAATCSWGACVLSLSGQPLARSPTAPARSGVPDHRAGRPTQCQRARHLRSRAARARCIRLDGQTGRLERGLSGQRRTKSRGRSSWPCECGSTLSVEPARSSNQADPSGMPSVAASGDAVFARASGCLRGSAQAGIPPNRPRSSLVDSDPAHLAEHFWKARMVPFAGGHRNCGRGCRDGTRPSGSPVAHTGSGPAQTGSVQGVPGNRIGRIIGQWFSAPHEHWRR